MTPISSILATCHLVNFTTYITLWEVGYVKDETITEQKAYSML
jgi:hypothetical protein